MKARMNQTHYNRIKALEALLYGNKESTDSTFETAETLENLFFIASIKDRVARLAPNATDRTDKVYIAASSFRDLMKGFTENYGGWINAEKPFERATAAENLLEAYAVFDKPRLVKAFRRGVAIALVIGLVVGLVVGWMLKPG